MQELQIIFLIMKKVWPFFLSGLTQVVDTGSSKKDEPNGDSKEKEEPAEPKRHPLNSWFQTLSNSLKIKVRQEVRDQYPESLRVIQFRKYSAMQMKKWKRKNR